jgi:hypothetical protein
MLLNEQTRALNQRGCALPGFRDCVVDCGTAVCWASVVHCVVSFRRREFQFQATRMTGCASDEEYHSQYSYENKSHCQINTMNDSKITLSINTMNDSKITL